jgi:superfamily II DNA or RNA helicase
MPTNSIDDRDPCDNGAPAAVQPLPPGVAPGASVTVRGRRWRVEATVPHADCRELHLAGAAPSDRRVLLWPFDRPVAADPRPRLRCVRLRAWAAAVAAARANAVDPLTPRARVAAADILPYQLSPAVAVAEGASRVLLADEVGLGKTIQAGWIIADLFARDRAVRVLVAVPAGLRRQWAQELSTFFDIDTIGVDARWLRATVADIPADVSPWAPPGVYLGSMDFLKRPDVAASLDAQIWDLLVVDEAHTATSPTERHAALAEVAARARRIVTITATPYSGDTASFASLITLGASAGEPDPLMFRRSREDVGDPRRRRHRFAAVRITRAEWRLQRLLERYSRNVWREAPGDVEGARLAVTILRKRALSSPAAAARSLERRLALLLSREMAVVPRQLSLFDDEDVLDDDLPQAALAAPGLADAAQEQRWLTTLVEAAHGAVTIDSKERCLQRLLTRVRAESVIVFTEYRDTLLQLAAGLPPSLQLHGGLTTTERAEVQARFNETGGLLLATDAAAEGLNLQRRCRLVVNYELPWNPARLEQRIGRVDRIGQQRAVHAITLVARDTAEDLVIANLSRRLARVVATLGERDRLGAFLTDARTAGLVIGDTSTDLPGAAAEVAAAPVSRQPAVSAAAHAAADQLRLARTVQPGAGHAPSASSDLLVSNLRASSLLRAGVVLVMRCTARSEEGDVAAHRVVALHASGNPPKPPTPAAARAMAATAIASFPDTRQVVSDLPSWFEDVQRIHHASIDRRVARERALLHRPAARLSVQRGLFDRRALRAAEEVSGAERDIQSAHHRRLEALEHLRPLHLSCIPVAVLIAWR